MAHETTKQDLDDAICKHFRNRRGHPTDSLELVAMASEVYPKASVPWRAIDRRIQALRKSGRLRYNRELRAWVVMTG